jgi:hypothetical protein
MSPLRIQKLIGELSEGNEDLFAEGLMQELETRKQEICKNLSIKIFESIVKEPVDKTVDVNDDIKQLIETITHTEAQKNIKMQFKNASILNISENDLKPALIESIVNENAVDFRQIVNQVLLEKLSVRLEEEYQDVSKTMFTLSEADETEEELEGEEEETEEDTEEEETEEGEEMPIDFPSDNQARSYGAY